MNFQASLRRSPYVILKYPKGGSKTHFCSFIRIKLGVTISDVNKDWTHKDQDKDKDQSHKDKDKD